MKILRFMCYFLVLFSLVAVANAQSKKRGKVYSLATEAREASGDAKNSIASKREAELSLDRAALAAVTSFEAIDLELFDGKSYLVERGSTEVRALDDSTWRGK